MPRPKYNSAELRAQVYFHHKLAGVNLEYSYWCQEHATLWAGGDTGKVFGSWNGWPASKSHLCFTKWAEGDMEHTRSSSRVPRASDKQLRALLRVLDLKTSCWMDRSIVKTDAFLLSDTFRQQLAALDEQRQEASENRLREDPDNG